MNPDLLSTFVNISSFSIVIPLAIALFQLKTASREQLILTTLVACSFITEVIANLLWYQFINNLAVYNSYALVNFNLLFLLYYYQFGSKTKKFMVFVQILFNILAVLNTLFLQKTSIFNSNLTTSAALVLIACALAYFYKLLKEIKYQKLEKNPLFWINSGVILYYSGSLILFLLGNVLAYPSLEVALAAWGLNSFFNLLLNTAYSIALWIRSTK